MFRAYLVVVFYYCWLSNKFNNVIIIDMINIMEQFKISFGLDCDFDLLLP